MIGSIKLTRFTGAVDLTPEGGQHLWPLSVVAQGLGDYPSEVFVFQKGSAADHSTLDQFRCVASAHDIFELGTVAVIADGEETSTPFYRGSNLNLYLRSAEEVERIWLAIKGDTESLVKNIDAANSLLATDQVDISTEQTETDDLTMNGQKLFTLSYKPAGIADIDVDSDQTILTPDATLPGWLPVSEATAAMDVPAGASFFYNITKHTDMPAELPFLEPGNQHLMYVNGVKLTHGQAYQINDTGIYWMAYDPILDQGDVVFSDGDTLLQANVLGNAPWPIDYVDAGNPGSDTPNIELLLFT